MFHRGPKVSLSVLVLAVLAVGIGAFIAGQLFAGRDIGRGYIASPVYEDAAQEENDTVELILHEDVTEPCEEPMGIAIYVYNPMFMEYRREALMRSMDDALAAKHLLAQRFLTGYTVWYGLDPDWRLQPVYLDGDVRFDTPQDVSRILDRRIRNYEPHVIEDGESFDEIALLWDMELSELLRINSISEAAPLEPGQKLWVVAQHPLINVITIEEVAWLEPLYRAVEVVYVTSLARSQTRVVREGRDGYQAVERRITRRGTAIIEDVFTTREIIVDPVTMIVEIGQ